MKNTIMNTPFRLTQNQRRIAATFMLASLLPTAALALPTLHQVASGSAAISTSGNAMTVTNSANAIINWQSFSIGQGESTRFIQPSAASSGCLVSSTAVQATTFGHNQGRWSQIRKRAPEHDFAME